MAYLINLWTNLKQGILDYTGMETLKKEPMLAKLLQELKYQKKNNPLVFLICLQA